MYMGQLATASNRADWSEVVTLTDKDTGDLIDISLCTITMSVRPQLKGSYAGIDSFGYDDSFYQSNDWAPLLIGSTDTGEIVLVDVGTFQWTFPASKMAALTEKMYEV